MSNFRPEGAEIRPLSKSKAKKFIKEHHYSGNCHVSPLAWGLVIDDQLKGAIAFANPIAEEVRSQVFGKTFRGTVTELHRLVTLDECPKNTESWLISKGLECLKSHSPQFWAVVSYADSTLGHTGMIYQATNAIYFGTTEGTHYYIDQEGSLRPHRRDNTTISREEARSRGWEVSERDGKHSYLYLLPKNKNHKRKLKEMLKVDPKPYPSNDTERHEEEVSKSRQWIPNSASETDW